jgi:hypothetical protein
MDGTCIKHEEDEKCVQNFSRKSEWKEPLGRSSHRCEEDIQIDLKSRV